MNLIEDVQKNTKVEIAEAVRLALRQAVGAYAIVVLSSDEPETIVVAKRGSPVVIGIGKDEFFIASDATPLVEYTNKVTYLEDDEMAVIKSGKLFVPVIVAFIAAFLLPLSFTLIALFFVLLGIFASLLIHENPEKFTESEFYLVA